MNAAFDGRISQDLEVMYQKMDIEHEFDFEFYHSVRLAPAKGVHVQDRSPTVFPLRRSVRRQPSLDSIRCTAYTVTVHLWLIQEGISIQGYVELDALVLSKKCRKDICVAVPCPEIHGDASPVRRELISV